MYTETVSDTLWRTVQVLSPLSAISRCYLAGGTALALQLGHRLSEDLDFFSSHPLDESSIVAEISSAGLKALIVSRTSNHLELIIEAIKVDLIRECIPLEFPLIRLDTGTAYVMVADARDIGRLKIFSIASRGSRKDFIDLFCLTRRGIDLETLVSQVMEEGKNVRYSKLLFLKGLIDFEEADREPDPSMLWDLNWEDVKATLVKAVKEIARKIYD